MSIESTKNQIDNGMDNYLFIYASLLVITSIIFSYSLTSYITQKFDVSEFYFFQRQLIVGLFTIIMMWFLGQINPKILFGKFMVIVFSLSSIIVILMSTSLLSNIVVEVGGAKRWIRVGSLTISPTEFLKVGIAYFFAVSFTRKLYYENVHTLKTEMTKVLAYFGVIGLVGYFIAFKQKDLGQFVVIYMMFFTLLSFANRSKKLSFIVFLLSIGSVVLLVILEGHRTFRIATWWVGVQDIILAILPSFLDDILRVYNVEVAYQVSQSLNAIYNGGWFGTGLGEGNFKMGFLTEVHTDFVLAGISEEIGFVGLFIIVFIYILMILRILQISARVNETRYYLFSIAIAVMFSVSFFINIYGIASIIPMKGIAVPFLSYGGSSLLSSGLAIGLMLSISRTKIAK